MVKNLFAQLELLVKGWQINHLKRVYSDLTGIKFGDGFLWQHPGNHRRNILLDFQTRLHELGLQTDGLDSRV